MQHALSLWWNLCLKIHENLLDCYSSHWLSFWCSFRLHQQIFCLFSPNAPYEWCIIEKGIPADEESTSDLRGWALTGERHAIVDHMCKGKVNLGFKFQCEGVIHLFCQLFVHPYARILDASFLLLAPFCSDRRHFIICYELFSCSRRSPLDFFGPLPSNAMQETSLGVNRNGSADSSMWGMVFYEWTYVLISSMSDKRDRSKFVMLLMKYFHFILWSGYEAVKERVCKKRLLSGCASDGLRCNFFMRADLVHTEPVLHGDHLSFRCNIITPGPILFWTTHYQWDEAWLHSTWIACARC